tara:strand:+ start:143 stop:505 length:363 start_codon:yes stop_codon:yes gene_type:complete
MITVTCAIIEKGNKFLITQRPNDGRSNANRWEFPGGKVENEEMEDCLKREIKEELGVDIEILEEFITSTYENIKLVSFKCELKGDIQHIDIINHAWVSKEELNNYDICEADLPIIDNLFK